MTKIRLGNKMIRWLKIDFFFLFYWPDHYDICLHVIFVHNLGPRLFMPLCICKFYNCRHRTCSVFLYLLVSAALGYQHYSSCIKYPQNHHINSTKYLGNIKYHWATLREPEHRVNPCYESTEYHSNFMQDKQPPLGLYATIGKECQVTIIYDLSRIL